MAYFRTKLEGAIAVTKGTSAAATAASMPNFGTSIIANTSGEAWVLQAPYAGVRKRVVFTGLTSANTNILRACTTGGDDITFVGATTGINALSVTTGSGAFAMVIDLEGQNTTSWIITNIFPESTVATIIAPSSS
jgi:exosortase/archaeosortase